VDEELILIDYSVIAKQEPYYLHREQEKSYMKLYKASTNNTQAHLRDRQRSVHTPGVPENTMVAQMKPVHDTDFLGFN
jgi:hypothetical protein